MMPDLFCPILLLLPSSCEGANVGLSQIPASSCPKPAALSASSNAGASANVHGNNYCEELHFSTIRLLHTQIVYTRCCFINLIRQLSARITKGAA